MKARRFLALPLLFLLFAPATAAAQANGVPPTVVVRVHSIDALFGHAKFLAKMAGQEDAVRQIEGLIQGKLGQNGLEGVDGKKPIGFYLRMGKELDDIAGAALIPISNENAFLNLLKNLNVQIAKGADGIYTIKTGSPVDAYLRFANQYAYVTALNTTALEEKNLLAPAKVLAGKPTTAFALTIRLDQVPDAAKLIAMAQAEQLLQEVQNQKVPGETDTQKAFKVAACNEIGKFIAAVLKEGAELTAEVDLNEKGDLAATFSLSGMAKSELAAGIEAIAKNPSLFAGLLKSDAALEGMGHVKLPEALVKALGDVVDEAKALALAGIQEAAKKQQAEALFKVIVPTLKAGDFDGALVMVPSGKHFTVLTAFKVKDGTGLGKTVRELVSDSIKDLPPALQQKIKLDLDAVGPTKIHKIELPANNQEGKMAEAFLGDLSLYVAFRDDAVFLSVGKDGLAAIKEAVPVQASGAGPMLLYELDVARLPFLPPAAAAKAKQLFPGGQGGTIRFSVEGGAALTVRLGTKVSVLQFLGQIREATAVSN
jgi:hypothetical protein